jgi:hypothetical protein
MNGSCIVISMLKVSELYNPLNLKPSIMKTKRAILASKSNETQAVTREITPFNLPKMYNL